MSSPKAIHEPIHAPPQAVRVHGAFTPFTLDHETAGQPIHEPIHAIHAQAIHDRPRAYKARAGDGPLESPRFGEGYGHADRLPPHPRKVRR